MEEKDIIKGIETFKLSSNRMEKIVNNEIETDDDEVIRLMKNYNNDKNVNNLRKIYEAYIESIIEKYELEISKNGENIYKNFK